MATRPTGAYGPVAQALHWLVFALVLAQYVVAILMPDIGRGTVPGTLIDLHMSFGALILVAIVVRWLWRIGHPVPLATGDLPRWEQSLARVLHTLLYLLLAVNPILGWMNASARDWTIAIFGLSRCRTSSRRMHGSGCWPATFTRSSRGR